MMNKIKRNNKNHNMTYITAQISVARRLTLRAANSREWVQGAW